MPFEMDGLTRKIGDKIEKARVKVNAYRFDKGFGTFPKFEEAIAKKKAEAKTESHYAK